MQVVKNVQAAVAAFLGASQKKKKIGFIFIFLLYLYLDKKKMSRLQKYK